MRKLELYNTTTLRIAELQRQLSTQKERFLEGQSDYLIRVSDKMTKIRDDADLQKKFINRMVEAVKVATNFAGKKSQETVKEMNDLLRRTQTYLNIIHDVEMSESKLHTLITQAELLEEQALVQEKLTYLNTLMFLNNMTIEQKVNQLVVADNNENLAKFTPERQKIFMKCLGYTKDLIPNANDVLLNSTANGLYECVKEISDEDLYLYDNSIKQLGTLVLDSLAISLMEQNQSLVDVSSETVEPLGYDDIFGTTNWVREYTRNEFVDINGIIDQGVPIHQVIVTEIASRIEVLNCSYDVTKTYVCGMSDSEMRDIYLLSMADYKKKYDNKIDTSRIKKYVAYTSMNDNESVKTITKALELSNNSVKAKESTAEEEFDTWTA